MTATNKREQNRQKAASYRERQRAKGLKLVQRWLPDTKSKEFLEEAARQSKIAAASPYAAEDQAWVDSVSWFNDPANDER
ncbi:antitoxin MazE-like protein [Rhizobium sp. LjRoot254]|uniref:antitoxin MazE-like protein n=1 Tax=Rhizobium sp. LjRoot254 TaxID=3342297 RepID=UPI003ECF5AA3